jgi:hypothetical protein
MFATRTLHNHKAPSPFDAINNELLKYGGDSLHVALTTLYNLQWEYELKAQTPGVICALFKRGDAHEAKNYRPITLGSTLDKLYNLIINTRLVEHIEEEQLLHDSQQAFRPGRCTSDNILMLNTVLQGRLSQKQSTYLLFLDIEKAYDTVWRSGLLWQIWQLGIRGKMFRVLAQICNASSSVVSHRGCFSEIYKPGMGWEQGDTLATTMFNIYVNTILQHVWDTTPGIPLPNTDNKHLSALMFADDFVGLASTPENLQSLINTVRAQLTKWRLKASVSTTDTSKTTVMVVQRNRGQTSSLPANTQWTWNDVPLPIVESYKYLGVLVSHDGSWDKHISNRLQKASAAAKALYGVLYNNSLSWEARQLALTSAVMPVAHYATEVWCKALVTQRQQLDSWQMQIVTAMTHSPPTTSHACLQQELGLEPMHVACDIATLTYWHRLQTLSTDRLINIVTNAWQGKANPWQQNIKKLITLYKIDKPLAITLSKDKFKKYLSKLKTDYVHQLWQARENRGSSVLTRYRTTYSNPTTLKIEKAQPYFLHLSHQGRGRAAELCMQLRMESLPLKSRVTRKHRTETDSQLTTRRLCPCCSHTTETTTHFLLHCNSYNVMREQLMHELQKCSQWAHFMNLSDDVQATQLLKPEYWNNMDTFQAIATFIIEAWKVRSLQLHPAPLSAEINGLTPPM